MDLTAARTPARIVANGWLKAAAPQDEYTIGTKGTVTKRLCCFATLVDIKEAGNATAGLDLHQGPRA